ncbi:hypothetical protein, partial [Pseudomonas amygdali]|uniref:hypothetical protein n=1 Tax=Pseudomonas amygdali TaxID=47877 RepID=UPI00287B63BD
MQASRLLDSQALGWWTRSDSPAPAQRLKALARWPALQTLPLLQHPQPVAHAAPAIAQTPG